MVRSCILFDFFGTLVDYLPGHAEEARRSHDLLRRWGVGLGHREFLAAWAQTFAAFERRSDVDDREFSMGEATEVFLTRVLRRRPDRDEVAAFVDRYLRDWNLGVRYPPGIDELVRELGRDHRLAVVTNTHQPDLVPNHLAAMGIAGHFEIVTTSVEVGWRKPHPEIYARTLRALGVDASAAVFVGDSYRPDFLGPQRAGITAYLIDPLSRAPVPADRRLASVFDLPRRLRAHPPRQPGGGGGDRGGGGGRTVEHRAGAGEGRPADSAT